MKRKAHLTRKRFLKRIAYGDDLDSSGTRIGTNSKKIWANEGKKTNFHSLM